MELHIEAAIVPLSAGLLGVVCLALAQAFAHRKISRRSARDRDGGAPAAISVLKPLKGIDDSLYENLASFARQDHDAFELLLGAEDPRDPALAVARQVRRDFPHVPIRIIVREGTRALNPKVSNLLNLFEVAAYDRVLISDSNVAVDPGYLRAIARELEQPNVGLVSSVIVGRGDGSVGSRLENVQLGTFVIAAVCAADALGHPIVVGKSMLLRRSELGRIGGLEAVGDVLAEDYVLGQRYDDAGMRVVLSSEPVYTEHRSWTVERVWSRHLRWAQLRRWTEPKLFALEAALYPVPWLAIAAICGSHRTRDVALLALAFKLVADCVLLAHARGHWPRPLAVALIPLRDCMLLGAWALALVRRTVVWRGNLRRIGPGTRLTASPDRGLEQSAPAS